MPCFFPLRAFRSRDGRNPDTGKWSITFDYNQGYTDLAVLIPCGKCEGCRMDYSRQWALRCMHESKLHDKNCVLTLTYDDAHLPADGSLDKVGFQKWLKILRSRIGSFRYFGCGEYGANFSRPHYHMILFGYDFPDKELKTVHLGSRQYDSVLLRSIWTKGLVSLGDVSFKSAAYIARYCFKKQIEKEDYGNRQPEYIFMSNRPGIGSDFAKKYSADFLSASACVSGNQKFKIPKYYEKHFSPAEIEHLHAVRSRYVQEESPQRTLQKREVLLERLKFYTRSFETLNNEE